MYIVGKNVKINRKVGEPVVIHQRYKYIICLIVLLCSSHHGVNRHNYERGLTRTFIFKFCYIPSSGSEEDGQTIPIITNQKPCWPSDTILEKDHRRSITTDHKPIEGKKKNG